MEFVKNKLLKSIEGSLDGSLDLFCPMVLVAFIPVLSLGYELNKTSLPVGLTSIRYI